MKEQNNIDKLFSEGLQDFRLDYNKEEVWDNIQKKKNKKRILWVWFFGSIFLAILFGTLYSNLSPEPKIVYSENKTNIESIKINENEVNNIKKEESKEIIEWEYTSNNVQETVINKAKKQNTQLKSYDAKTAIHHNNNQNVFGGSQTKRNQTLQRKLIDLHFSENKSISINEEYKSEINALIDESILNNSAESQLEKISSLTFNQTDNSQTKKNINQVFNIEILKSNELTLFPNQEIKLAIIPDSIKIFYPKINKFSFEYNGVVYKQFTNYLNPLNAIRTQIENETNNDMFSYSNQLLLVYRSTNWLSFTAGIEQMQIFQSFYWNEIQGTSDLVFNENALFIEDNGTQTMIGDSTFSLASTMKIRQSQQILNLYNIPIGFRINKNWNNWTIGSSFSTVINFNHSFTGFRFNEKYDDIEKQIKNRNHFEELISGSFDIAPFVEYGLNESFRIRIHSNFRGNTNRKLSNNLVIKSRMLGLGVGVNFHLN